MIFEIREQANLGLEGPGSLQEPRTRAFSVPARDSIQRKISRPAHSQMHPSSSLHRAVHSSC